MNKYFQTTTTKQLMKSMSSVELDEYTKGGSSVYSKEASLELKRRAKRRAKKTGA